MSCKDEWNCDNAPDNEDDLVDLCCCCTRNPQADFHVNDYFEPMDCVETEGKK